MRGKTNVTTKHWSELIYSRLLNRQACPIWFSPNITTVIPDFPFYLIFHLFQPFRLHQHLLPPVWFWRQMNFQWIFQSAIFFQLTHLFETDGYYCPILVAHLPSMASQVNGKIFTISLKLTEVKQNIFLASW